MGVSYERGTPVGPALALWCEDGQPADGCAVCDGSDATPAAAGIMPARERDFFMDNLLVRVHLIIEMSRPALRHGRLNSLFQVACRRWSSNPSGKCSYERPTRGTICRTMRSMCGADAGCLAINYQSLCPVTQITGTGTPTIELSLGGVSSHSGLRRASGAEALAEKHAQDQSHNQHLPAGPTPVSRAAHCNAQMRSERKYDNFRCPPMLGVRRT